MLMVEVAMGVYYEPHDGLVVNEFALELSPEELHEAIRFACEIQHEEEWSWVAACHGTGLKLLENAGYTVSYSEYHALVNRLKARVAALDAKKENTYRRRTAFNARRSQLILEMIESGILYQCANPECTCCEDLTVDHIQPLSRGGGDELANLQFLCRKHNSEKHDAPRPESLSKRDAWNLRHVRDIAAYIWQRRNDPDEQDELG